VVVTDRGPVQGTAEGSTWAYLGIPFAAPPIGSLRWAAPQVHECWSSALATTAFAAVCPQIDPANTANVLGQEDCLTANVWVPSAVGGTSALPVLVFIHGGGNVQGSASATSAGGATIYDGAALAAKANVVVVTFQYRLGPLGFLAHPSFGANPGNYGTLDQIFALGWVKRNAAAFGGDPTHLLLFGQSAGAEDVCNMVASPLAKGLFAAALMESGGCTARPLATAEAFAHSWAQKAGCDSAADPAGCLRALGVNAVLQNIPELASVAGGKQGDYEPDIDGVALPDASDKMIAAGNHNHVPFVIGSNSDETSLELAKSAVGAAIKTAQDYQAAVLQYAGGNQALASAVLAQYPASSYATPLEAYIQVTTDAKFTCSARYAARVAIQGQADAPVWRYFYTHHLDGSPVTPIESALGAWHGQELGMVFRDYGGGQYTPSAAENALADAIDTAWASLAATGAPAPSWPRYQMSDPYTQLDDTITTGAGVRTSLCDFWDGVLGR
jgi:para-nitrobenzyl esterase